MKYYVDYFSSCKKNNIRVDNNNYYAVWIKMCGQKMLFIIYNNCEIMRKTKHSTAISLKDFFFIYTTQNLIFYMRRQFFPYPEYKHLFPIKDQNISLKDIKRDFNIS